MITMMMILTMIPPTILARPVVRNIQSTHGTILLLVGLFSLFFSLVAIGFVCVDLSFVAIGFVCVDRLAVSVSHSRSLAVKNLIDC